MLEEFDQQVSILSESFARKFNRRKVIGSTVKGVVATVAAATVGQLANLGQAFAASCTCDEGWTLGKTCGYYGFPCPKNGCPSQCTVCTRPSCHGWCNWNSGNWVSCSGLGPSGKGYKLCWDCWKCGNVGGNCQPKCSCLSACIGC
jgi:hypothetical protein